MIGYWEGLIMGKELKLSDEINDYLLYLFNDDQYKISVILQQKLPAAKLSIVFTVYNCDLQTAVKHGYYSIFQLSLLLLLDHNYQYITVIILFLYVSACGWYMIHICFTNMHAKLY